MEEKSIIIIGAGLAGLSAGCYARMNGYKTQIFEMHNIPGGLCTSWKRKGYVFDGCIHYMMGSRSGTYHRFYEELGAVQGRRMVDNEELLRVQGSGGKVWIVYADIDRLEQHMKELSPADAAVIEELCNAARLLVHFEIPIEKPTELMGPLDVLKLLKDVPALRAISKYGKVSMQDYAARFKDPFLREVFPLIIENIPDMPMMAVLMTLAYLHQKNNGWPIGGSLEFARAIEKRYRDLGGKVQYKSRVEKILVQAGQAVGVRLANGTEHHADLVISAADGRTTIFDMLDGKYIDDKIRHDYDERPIFGPYVQISLGVARDFSQEPHSLILEPQEPLKVGDQTRRWIPVKHYCYDPTMAPLGKSVVTVSFLFANYEYWKKLYQDREQYKVEKQTLADAVIDQMEKRFPGIKEQIEVVDVATPVTFERYTGNWQGSYMGWQTTPATGIKPMSKTLPGLGSFYMAGQWVLPGGGVSGAIVSGRHVIQIICKKDKKRFMTTVP
ncbi:MAG: NAD(P)/FAD-dependent oxidoreductase [Chloroflexi bacterium]|nr:NAD(P)/FAD-dependent oxidoreductase [Chloroflexota bacterium]